MHPYPVRHEKLLLSCSLQKQNVTLKVSGCLTRYLDNHTRAKVVDVMTWRHSFIDQANVFWVKFPPPFTHVE